MTLIKQQQSICKSDVRIKIPMFIKEEANAYCKWAGIEDMSYFFTEAAKVVFEKDKDWQRVKKELLNEAKAMDVIGS